MKSLDDQLAAYGAHHTKKWTKITHLIGIPAIVLGLIVLFTWVRIDFFDRYTIALAWFFVVGTLIYYYMLDAKVAGIMTIVFIPITLLTVWWTGPAPTEASVIVFFVLFVGGWIVQFVGHGIEKKKPAFLAGAFQIFIAPVFIVLEILSMCGLHIRDTKKPQA
ncbi:MAG: DUF962 domain-containing protein [Coxiellaceae bacterium]|nr:DUF962 domain-containing protein [Coxiellaceae bacterium]